MKEENEQNLQIVTFKLEQIASMTEATQQMEEKIDALSTELEKEKAERKEESKQHLEKIKDLTTKCKLLKAKNEKMKAAAPAAAPAKEKPKKLSLFSRRGAAASPKSESEESEESEDSEEEALWIVCLSHPVLDCDEDMAKEVFVTVTQKLLNRYGLQTLASGEKGFSAIYKGSPEERDSVYHQGITWPWLLGLYYNALKNMRDYAESDEEKESLQQKIDKFSEKTKKTFTKEIYENGCIGSIAEILVVDFVQISEIIYGLGPYRKPLPESGTSSQKKLIHTSFSVSIVCDVSGIPYYVLIRLFLSDIVPHITERHDSHHERR